MGSCSHSYFFLLTSSFELILFGSRQDDANTFDPFLPVGAMKALGEAAIDLPWACPSAASLAVFAPGRSDLSDNLRHDPGALLLLLRDAPSDADAAFELSDERY